MRLESIRGFETAASFGITGEGESGIVGGVGGAEPPEDSKPANDSKTLYRSSVRSSAGGPVASVRLYRGINRGAWILSDESMAVQ